MTEFIVMVVFYVLFFLLVGLFRTWYGCYHSFLDWYYHEVNTDPHAGGWYYKNTRKEFIRGRSGLFR